MQNLNRLLQIAQAAAFITDLARHKQTYALPAVPAATIYLHTSDAALRVVRWGRQQVEATIETVPPIGWRVATDYDANGVYIVVIKRRGIGAVARATLNVVVPQDAHLVLRQDNGMVTLDHVYGTLYIAPPDGNGAHGTYLLDSDSPRED